MQSLACVHERNLGSDEAPMRSQLLWVVEIAAASALHRSLPLEHIHLRALCAIRLGQLRIFFNPRDEPVGYLMWAFVSDDVQLRFMGGSMWPLHVSEWNEGPHAWVVDFAAPYGHAGPIVRHVLRDARSPVPLVRYLGPPSARCPRVRQILVH